jgi:hypothetical protein
MKNEILQLIQAKKVLFKQEVNEGVAELQKIKAEAAQRDKKEAMLLVMERIPLIKTKIVSAKVLLSVLTELEKEINDLETKKLSN